MATADSPDFDPDKIIDAMAPLLGVTIEPNDRAAVITNIRVTASLAALVLEFPLGDHAEPAMAFRP